MGDRIWTDVRKETVHDDGVELQGADPIKGETLAVYALEYLDGDRPTVSLARKGFMGSSVWHTAEEWSGAVDYMMQFMGDCLATVDGHNPDKVRQIARETGQSPQEVVNASKNIVDLLTKEMAAEVA